MRFAYSSLVSRGGNSVAGLGIVEAISRDEAIGKAARIQQKLYPTEEGWTHQSVIAIRADSPPIDPERAHIVEVV